MLASGEETALLDFARNFTLDEWRSAARCAQNNPDKPDLTITETAHSIRFQGSEKVIESQLAEADKNFDRRALFALPGVAMAYVGLLMKECTFSRPMRLFGGAWTTFGVLQELVEKPRYHKSLESFKDTYVAKSELRANP